MFCIHVTLGYQIKYQCKIQILTDVSQ